MTAQSPSEVPDEDVLFTDVLIIGAGLSGIGAAYRIKERNPGLSFAILERRSRIGGTWDLFRYPGVRSDSDIFTLSYPFEPWTRPEAIADGDHIREYLSDTARRHRIDQHITFDTRVRSADWDSGTDTWTVQAEQGGIETIYSCRFLYFATGYYNYDDGYRPDFPGETQFAGQIVHPQFWPDDLDYQGKKVVVIGSGATAMTLVPSMARSAESVTMLQRSPTYVFSGPRVNRVANVVRKVLPRKISHALIRSYYAIFQWMLYQVCRLAPITMAGYLRRMAVRNLPSGYDVDTHFTPSYNPWDQRVCLIPEADLFTMITQRRAEVVTDRIESFDADGITLVSGRHLDADIIVTATGLQLQALGGVVVSVDGTEVKLNDRFVYKEYLIEDLPNLAWSVGYTNASWTLRSDMTARSVAKLLAHMGEHGYTHAYPHRDDEALAEIPSWDLQAGYILRSPHVLPKSGTRRPWHVRHNYVLDAIDHRFDRIEESMVFGRVEADAAARA